MDWCARVLLMYALLCAAVLPAAAGDAWSAVHIRSFYDESFAGLPVREQTIVKEVLVEPVVQWLARVLKVRTLLPSAIQFPRACKSEGFLINDMSYCVDECADRTMCGPFAVQSEHLAECRKCEVDSRRLVCDAGEGGEGGEGGGTHLLLYVGAVDEDSCLRGYGAVRAGHCLQEPEYDRPTVVFLNFCPQAISASLPQHVVLHEFLHALAFSEELLPFFRDADGYPRSRRSLNGQPLVHLDGSHRVDSTTVRYHTWHQWSSYSGPTTHSKRMLVTPNVVREVRAHFNCSSWLGAELEDLAAGSSLHWEKRVFGEELMTAAPSNQPVLSRISLALLQDSGWYLPDYEFAGNLVWGSSKGCAFINDSCGGWLAWSKQRGEAAAPFCDSQERYGCANQRASVAPCVLRSFPHPPPPHYQYLSPPLGGVQPLADFCPMFTALHYSTHSVGRSCLEPSHAPSGVNIAAESYGRDSRCFEHYSPFVMTLNESHTQQSLQGAGCYQVSVRLVGEGWGCELLLLQFLCTSRRVVVVVGKQRLRCSPSAEGNRRSVKFVEDGIAYSGAIVCPSYRELCAGYNCLRMCSGHGVCAVNGRCLCHVGYFGEDCSRSFSDQLLSCDDVECVNNGSCTDTDRGFVCSCPSAFTGARCESDLVADPCAAVNCSGYGDCHVVSQGTRAQCMCRPPYVGSRCEQEVDLCAYLGRPCLNNGSCVSTGNQSSRCECQPGFEGVACGELVVDPCAEHCLNGATCSLLNSTQPLCHCDDKHFGERCEHYDYCAQSPCLNGATCVNVNNGTYSCTCVQGYRGLRCRKRAKPCQPNPCQNSGTCRKEKTNSTVTVSCVCSHEFTGEYCQLQSF